MSNPRELLQAHGLWSKKGLGQHFLVDPAIPPRIVSAGGAGPDDAVFEIGAGTGVLTHALSSRVARVIALEYDRDLVPVLRAQFGGSPHVTIRPGDVRDQDWGALATELGQRPIVYGNVPYNLSSPIVAGLIEAGPVWRRACLLLQKEFAERAAAPPGTRACCTLSALVALWTHATIAFWVPPSAFLPPPKVDSAVLILERRAEPAADVGDPAVFRQVVKALFAQRRKMARGALKPLYPDAEALLRAAGLEPTRRGETFTLDELAALSRALIAARAAG
ncbi:MAG: 16S rRNA (adenine(1518)-N(6)/adenine(1519)-N(6))-dimethyltransferase RsmA [bacterium]